MIKVKFKNIIKNNFKFIIIMLIVIILGFTGIAFALNISTFNPININITNAPLGINLSYLGGSGSTITSTGNLIPISTVPDTITNLSEYTNENVLKIGFTVSTVSTNPNNTMFDIALYDIAMDCNLKNEYFKWRLYKNNTLISLGDFSRQYDLSIDTENKLILTNTQQDLTDNEDTYVLLIWIANSCEGSLDNCTNAFNQNKMFGKSFSANLKFELSSGTTKKPITRITDNNLSCNYTPVSAPICQTLTYNGTAQTLVNSSSNYTLVNNTGVVAGNYAVVAKLNGNNTWNNGSTDDMIINCSIGKKNVTITAADQDLNSFENSIAKITSVGLISGHTITSIYLYTDNGYIVSNNAIIEDSNGNNVTDNYNITYVKGTVLN